MPVIAGMAEYPESIEEDLKKANGKVFAVDALDIAKKSGTIKAVNVVMIGALARITGIAKDTWINAIKDEVPEKFKEVNIKAFEGGYVSEIRNRTFECMSRDEMTRYKTKGLWRQLKEYTIMCLFTGTGCRKPVWNREISRRLKTFQNFFTYKQTCGIRILTGCCRSA